MSEFAEIAKTASPAFLGAIAAYMAIRENMARIIARQDATEKRVDRVESRVDSLSQK